MEKEFIDLFELQSKLKDGIECLFPPRVWIKAEVSAIKARSGGHCYLELSQSDDKGLVAKASAIIWSSRYLAPIRNGMVYRCLPPFAM
jgi:exonuclease VII large subunit